MHSDDDVPLVEAGVDLPEASLRLVLVGGSCGENSHSLPDMTAPDQRVGLPPMFPIQCQQVFGSGSKVGVGPVPCRF